VGTIGIVYLVDEENFYFKDGNLTWLRNIQRNNLLPVYLYYWLISKQGRQKWRGLSIKYFGRKTYEEVSETSVGCKGRRHCSTC